MTRIEIDKNLHKQIMTNILLDIFKNLNDKIAFKGGTCALLFYNLPRLSLDLDFDILTPLNKEDIDNLEIILRKHGEIKDFYDKKHTIFFLLDYKKDVPNIKVEMNKRLIESNKYKSIWFLGVRMKIVDKATLLTNKMVALTNRRSPVTRDLYDVYHFLKVGFPINENIIKERTNKTLQQYLKYLVSFIQDNYTSKNVLDGLGEVLAEDQKKWAKDNLISETVKEIRTLRFAQEP